MMEGALPHARSPSQSEDRDMFKICLFSLAIATLTAAMISNAAHAERGRDGQLKILYWQAVSTVNPYLSGGTKDIEAASLVLEPLARYDETGTMFPALAADIPTVENGGLTADLMSITWTLRQDVAWSDGMPFTAADVVFSAEYCLNEEMGCNALSSFTDVTGVEALDDHTVRIHFGVAKPFPYGPFVGSNAPILQKAQFENCTGARAQTCTEQNFGPIGTGPFKVDEFRANDVIIFSANERYREPDKPAFATVTFKGGGDATSAARAVLATGEFDYAWNLQIEPEVLEQMVTNGKGTVVAGFGTMVERLVVNQTNNDPDLGKDKRSLHLDGTNPHPFLSDPAVRRALSLAIDRQILIDFGYGAAGQVTCNVLPAPPVYASTANDACTTPDIEEANRILDEAGWLPGDDGVRGEGRCQALDPLPDLHELGASGHPGPHQADVGADRGRDGAPQYRRRGVLRRRSGEPRHLHEVLRRHPDVHEQLRWRGPRGLHGQLDLLGDPGAGEPVAGREHRARLQRRIRRPRRRDGRDRLAGGTRRHRQADERHRRPEPVCDPAHLAREDFGACEHAEGACA